MDSMRSPRRNSTVASRSSRTSRAGPSSAAHGFLMARTRGGQPWGRFKIPRRSANPLITSAALFATLEACARQESFERATLPAALGLKSLIEAWKDLASPEGTSVSLSAAIDAAIIRAVLDETSRPPAPAQTAPGGAEPIDVKAWIDDATFICASEFEPTAEVMLQLGTLKVLGLDSFDTLGGDTPAATVSNTRFGYALRNWECQRIPTACDEFGDDWLAAELDECDASPATPRSRWLPRLINDVIVEGEHGGREAVLDSLPGANGQARREVLAAWGEFWPSDDPYTGRRVTEQLVLFGYLLHRAYDIRPHLLDD